MDLGLTADELALQARARTFANEVVRPRAAEIDAQRAVPLGHREGADRREASSA